MNDCDGNHRTLFRFARNNEDGAVYMILGCSRCDAVKWRAPMPEEHLAVWRQVCDLPPDAKRRVFDRLEATGFPDTPPTGNPARFLDA